MKDFMLDLETLGTTPGCVILSAGITAYNPLASTVNGIFCDAGHHTVIRKESCLDAMLHVDPDTVKWWSRQSGEARTLLQEVEKPTAPPLKHALEGVISYVQTHCDPKEARVWGNGADFDNPILAVAARHAEVELPWKWGNRCYRTIKNVHEFLAPDFAAPKLVRHGTYHNALDDARSQAMHHWELTHALSPPYSRRRVIARFRQEKRIEERVAKRALHELRVPNIPLKLHLGTINGWPDRVFLLGHGAVLFIEFKDPEEGELAILQSRAITLLTELNYNVQVHDNEVEAFEAIKSAKLDAAPIPEEGT